MLNWQRIMAVSSAGLINALPTVPKIHSGDNGSKFIFERHTIEAGSLPQHMLHQHCLLLPMGRMPVAYHSILDGKHVRGEMIPGQVQFRAANTWVSTEWFDEVDGIFISIEPELIHDGLPNSAQGKPVSLQSDLEPQNNIPLSLMILALDRVLKGQTASSPLFENALRNAICTNICINYAKQTPKSCEKRPTAQITRRLLRLVQNFIHSHYTLNISIADIAAVANLSPWHFCRAYLNTTGISLWQYVIQCRAAHALTLIGLQPESNLQKIADQCGFASYSQFIPALCKNFGVKPREIRKSIN